MDADDDDDAIIGGPINSGVDSEVTVPQTAALPVVSMMEGCCFEGRQNEDASLSLSLVHTKETPRHKKKKDI